MYRFLTMVFCGLVLLSGCQSSDGGNGDTAELFYPSAPLPAAALNGWKNAQPLPVEGTTTDPTGIPVPSYILQRLRGPSHRKVYKEMAPSVVFIANYQMGITDSGQRGLIFAGHGTGFIISKDGWVLTNKHVIRGAELVEIILKDPKKHVTEITADYQKQFTRVAMVVVIHDKQDMALLKILDPPSNLKVAELANPKDVEPAIDCIAIGHPADLNISATDNDIASMWDVTVGTVSNVQVKAGYKMHIRHTAPINPGNSGGPLFNLDGKVIGINYLRPSDPGHKGVYWSIGVTDAKKFLDDNRNIMNGRTEPGIGSVSSSAGFETMNVGWVAKNSTSNIRFKIEKTPRVGQIILGYEKIFARVIYASGEWHLQHFTNGKWVEKGRVDLPTGSWHAFAFERTGRGLLLKLDGKDVAELKNNLPPKGWAFLIVENLQATFQRR